MTPGAIAFTIGLALIAGVALLRLRRTGHPWSVVVAWGVFAIYLIIVARMVFLPRPGPPPRIGDPLQRAWDWGRHLSQPFSNPRATSTRMWNIAMTVPLGFMLPLLVRWSLWKIIAACFAFTLFIESSQLAISVAVGYIYRSFDVNDLLDNSIGAAIGLALFGALAVVYRVTTGLRLRALLAQPAAPKTGATALVRRRPPC